MTAILVAFLAGLLFAIGLGIGGMTIPAKITAFLDVTGAWDPSLMLVLGSAVVTYGVMYRLAIGRGKPLLASAYVLPGQTRVDAPLVAGAAVFGVGWGMSGFCPGPAVVALASGNTTVLAFVAAMVVGMWLHDGIAAVLRRATSRTLQTELPVAGSADG